MELKEVLNLRKLYEEFFASDEYSCGLCPFRNVCNEKHHSASTCIVQRIYQDPEDVEDDRDLYELEDAGELTDDVVLDAKKGDYL